MTTAAIEAPAPRSGRRVLELAALGVAAVPGIDPVMVIATRPTRDGVDTAVLRDRDSQDWVVAAPAVGAAGAGLEAEIAVLRLLAARLPFATPNPRGSAVMRGGGRALVYPALSGTPVSLPSLSADPSLAESVGRSIGAIHSLDPEEFAGVGLGVYDSQSLRRRCLATLDRGAEPGVVPAGLLTRWETSIEDASMWQFDPRPVHGELVSDRVLVEGSNVSGILDWAGARVSDPAEDLAWIAVGADADGLKRVLAAYRSARPTVDRHLVDRAVLHGEMALVSWLMHGLRAADGRIVSDATSMLQELAAWHDEHPSTSVTPTAAATGTTTCNGASRAGGIGGAASRPAQDIRPPVEVIDPPGTDAPGTDSPRVVHSSTDTVPMGNILGVTSVPRHSATRYGEAQADDTDVIDLVQVRAYLAARSGGTLTVAPASPTPARPPAPVMPGDAAAPVTLPTGDPSRTS